MSGRWSWKGSCASACNAAIDNTTVLEGFTIDNNFTGGNDGNGNIKIMNGAAPKIKNCIIKGKDLTTWGAVGAGIYINGGGATIDTCIIGDAATPNKARYGAGMYINTSLDVTVTDTDIISNTFF